jgi:8-oxo-dGTP diphosphatase
MRPRAAVILLQGEKIALIERHRQGRHYIVFPGGKIEKGETPGEAAKREVKEELGLDVAIHQMVAEVWYQGSPQYYFLADVTGGQFGHGTGNEMNSLSGSEKGTYLPVWIPVAEILKQPILPRLVAEFVQRSIIKGWPENPLIVRDQQPDSVE